MEKKNILSIAVLVVVAGGMFYGGMLYGASRPTKATSQFGQGQGRGSGGGNGADNGGGPGGQRGQRGPGVGGPNGGGGFSGGQIISKDDTSITIKTRDGGSKIVFFSGSTTVGKTVPGASSDLSVGENVMVNGTANPDGSIAAGDIQIRPEHNQQQ